MNLEEMPIKHIAKMPKHLFKYYLILILVIVIVTFYEILSIKILEKQFFSLSLYFREILK